MHGEHGADPGGIVTDLRAVARPVAAERLRQCLRPRHEAQHAFERDPSPSGAVLAQGHALLPTGGDEVGVLDARPAQNEPAFAALRVPAEADGGGVGPPVRAHGRESGEGWLMKQGHCPIGKGSEVEGHDAESRVPGR